MFVHQICTEFTGATPVLFVVTTFFSRSESKLPRFRLMRFVVRNEGFYWKNNFICNDKRVFIHNLFVLIAFNAINEKLSEFVEHYSLNEYRFVLFHEHV